MTLTIPVGAEARRLRFLFDTKSGATPSSGVEEYWDGDINWVTPEDLGKLADRYVRETRRRITEEGYKNCGVSLASAGSIVLSKRAPIGQTAILAVPSTCNQGCFLLTKLDGIDERFYFYSLIHLRPALEALGRGSTFMELSADDLRSILLPFPNEERQRLIANYLDRETARIDGLIAEKERMLALLEEKRHSLVHRAIAHKGTEMVRIQHVADLIARPIPRLDDEAYTPIGLLNRGRGIFHKESTLGCDLGDSEFFFIKQEDLIVSGQFAWEGAVAVAKDAEEGFVVSHRYHVLKGHEKILNTTYLWAYLTTQFGDLILNDHSRGAAGRNRPLNATSLIKEKIPVPPYELQEEIAKHVAREERLKGVIDESKVLLGEHRAALITAAVTGQIPLEEMTG